MRKFLKSKRGNVAMIFALCLVPLMILMGGAVDLARQRGGEVGTQNALDAALLAVAHEALGKNNQQLTKDGREWFDAHLINSNLDITSFQITKDGQVITAEVVGTVDTTFLAIMGLDRLTVRRTASVKFGIQKVEVALVLDTTGSMGNNVSGSGGGHGGPPPVTKLAALKSAATTMMNSLETASDGSGQLEVGIVPFATYVNVGPDNMDESWIDSDAKSPVHADNLVEGLNRFDLMKHLGYDWKGCVMARPHPHDVKDSAPKLSKPETLFVPLFHPDETDPKFWWQNQPWPNNYVSDSPSLTGIPLVDGTTIDITDPLIDLSNPTKYGLPDSVLLLLLDLGYDQDDCPEDMDKNMGFGNNECEDPLDPSNWESVSINSNYTYFADVSSTIGPEFSCEMGPLSTLSSDWDALRTQIAGLTASGSTNITEGVMWGWRVLSSRKPFREGDNYAKNTRKILVLLSDGNNMIVRREDHPGKSDFSAYGYIANERLDGIDADSTQMDILDAMDDLTLEACSNIKAKGIRIITIRLDLTDARSEKILSTCASSKEDYIDAKNTADLEKAFAMITDDITQLYLSK